MGTPEKKSKPSLLNLCLREDLRRGGPSVNGMVAICGRLIDGERFKGAVGLIAGHGTPQMMAALHESGLVEPEHWKTWKARMTKADADLVLAEEEAWPYEVQEWATVILVSGL